MPKLVLLDSAHCPEKILFHRPVMDTGVDQRGLELLVAQDGLNGSIAAPGFDCGVMPPHGLDELLDFGIHKHLLRENGWGHSTPQEVLQKLAIT